MRCVRARENQLSRQAGRLARKEKCICLGLGGRTCDLFLAHASPKSLGLAHRPVLDFGAEAPEELVLLKVRRPSAVARELLRLCLLVHMLLLLFCCCFCCCCCCCCGGVSQRGCDCSCCVSSLAIIFPSF
jgi:hypothetical protein